MLGRESFLISGHYHCPLLGTIPFKHVFTVSGLSGLQPANNDKITHTVLSLS